MSIAEFMQVSVRLPTKTLFEGTASKLFAVAEDGAFGMLPNHVDFVTALVPSVLVLTSEEGDELFFGIDEGVLIKHGHSVELAVRRGVKGGELASLHDLVNTTFMHMADDEKVARSALTRLEAGIVRRFADLRKLGS